MARAAITIQDLDKKWAHHHSEWRDPAQITSQWEQAEATDPQLLEYYVRGKWWQVLAEAQINLIVGREYEHLLMAIGATEAGKPKFSFTRLPHPSGLAVDRERKILHVASTRNPNQIYEFRAVSDYLTRQDVELTHHHKSARPLVPVRSYFLPGSLYIHDLAMIDGELYANAVGHNAVIRLDSQGGFERVWWPHCIETEAGPLFDQNYIQLNSIAASHDLASSYFSASAAKLSRRRPGHKNFAVDKRGVIFSGATRDPLVYGLTRPHSARLYRDQLWVDNSGYGELGVGDRDTGQFKPLLRLPGWTRGLCFYGSIAFVGTSRVIPRFRQYAPGLQVEESLCGVHAVSLETGQILGSIIWPYGNQLFALEWLPAEFSTGFAFEVSQPKAKEHYKTLFYSFSTK